jgi:hypothetical protein
MPRGGSKPGERRGGRQKGSLNKLSIGRMKAQLAVSAPPSVLFTLFQRVGADRLVMGSDYPVGESDPIGFIKKCPSISETEALMITGKTAARGRRDKAGDDMRVM